MLTSSSFIEYLRQVGDGSCKKIKSLTFIITDVKISHDTGINFFVQHEQLGWINSPVYYLIIPPMTL